MQPDRKKAKVCFTKLLRYRLGPRVQPEQEAAQGVETLAPGKLSIQEPPVVRVAKQQRNEVVIVVVDVCNIVRGPQVREIAR